MNTGAVLNSFGDADTTSQLTSVGGKGMNNAQMQTQANFISATNTWVMTGAMPVLQGELHRNPG